MTNGKDMWAAVRQLTGRRQTIDAVEGISAESLNQHYTGISTDRGNYLSDYNSAKLQDLKGSKATTQSDKRGSATAIQASETGRWCKSARSKAQ